MLRDKALIPLSHQHQHALALCVRCERAIARGTVNMEMWQAEIEQIFRAEIAFHFSAEEKDLFPLAQRIGDLQGLVDELLVEHAELRELFTNAASRSLQLTDLVRLTQRLSQHIRKEERHLFEIMQKELSPEELTRIGHTLNRSLAASVQICALPSNGSNR